MMTYAWCIIFVRSFPIKTFRVYFLPALSEERPWRVFTPHAPRGYHARRRTTTPQVALPRRPVKPCFSPLSPNHQTPVGEKHMLNRSSAARELSDFNDPVKLLQMKCMKMSGKYSLECITSHEKMHPLTMRNNVETSVVMMIRRLSHFSFWQFLFERSEEM